MDYRPIPAPHDDAFDATISYAFSPERGPDPDRDYPDPPESFRPRALYDVDDTDRASDAAERPTADDMTAVCGYYEFGARIRGGTRELAGIAAVASPPETRRRGLVRELLGSVHRELRDDGVAFAALWPFEYPFYRRLGYARIGDHTRITVAPDALASACPDPAGSYTRLVADDWRRLDDVYAEWADGDLGLDRSESWWRRCVFRSWNADPYVYGWVDGDGTLGGYVVYTVEDDDDGKTMGVSELAARDRRARGHLLRFCRNHDSQVERVRIRGPADARLFDDLADPRAADTEIRPGPMARVVDVAGALEAIEFPADAEGSVVLDVADDTCEWNDGTARLVVADGEGRVEAVDGDVEAAVELDVGALTRLVLGSHGVARLIELGEATVHDDAARRTLAAAFPPGEPYLREGF